jgi:hypothetical protein
VNGLKLADKDEVVGMEILPAEGEIFLITSEGKAKRVEQKEFPVQGRYGRGVIAWDLPGNVRLAGVVVDKPNHMATIHLTKGAPKSTGWRVVSANVRQRVTWLWKETWEVVSINVSWTVEKFVALASKVNGAKKASANGHKGTVKKPVKASANGKSKSAVKKSAPKKASAKGKASKPAKKSKSAKKKSRDSLPITGFSYLSHATIVAPTVSLPAS